MLRLQSDERLVALLRRGNTSAFEVLVARYETRLHAFCRHLLGSREDAEDVLQEVMTAAFNAMLADDRPINVRPWLYRIARNRSLNHLRRIQAIGVDSMDLHFSDGGASTADKVHEREEFRLLVGDIHELPETQKTALVLREMDALSYEQIAEAMETTVSSVKSLLVRARVSLAEASEARLLSCEEVRIELAEVAEGLRRRPGPLVRRHLRGCKRCTIFRGQLKQTNKALAALLPIGPTIFLKKLLVAHLGHSAASGSGATAAGSGAAGAGAAGAGAAGAGAAAGSGALVGGGGIVSAGIGAIATKAAAGIAAAALVTGAAVEANRNSAHHPAHHVTTVAAVPQTTVSKQQAAPAPSPVYSRPQPRSSQVVSHKPGKLQASKALKPAPTKQDAAKSSTTATTPTTTTTAATTTPATTPTTEVKSTATAGRTQTQSDSTVLPPVPPATPTSTAPAPPASAAGTETTPPPTTSTSTTTTPTTTTPTTTTTTTTTPTSTTETGTTTTTETTPPPTTSNPSLDIPPPAMPMPGPTPGSRSGLTHRTPLRSRTSTARVAAVAGFDHVRLRRAAHAAP
jgi:RNA polymerase sigma factor (sigma-70 family)